MSLFSSCLRQPIHSVESLDSMEEDTKHRMLGGMLMSPTISVLGDCYRTPRVSNTGKKVILKKGEASPQDEIACDSTASQRRPSKVIVDVDEISEKRHRMSLVLQEVSHPILPKACAAEEKSFLYSPDSVAVFLFGALLAGVVAMDVAGLM